MGFWSTVGRGFNAVDDALTTARVHASAHGEARRFERSVKPRRTYYSIETIAQPWGEEEVLAEWRFPDRFLGAPASGTATAAQVWLTNGPLYDKRPKGYQTMAEYSKAGHDWEPDEDHEDELTEWLANRDKKRKRKPPPKRRKPAATKRTKARR